VKYLNSYRLFENIDSGNASFDWLVRQNNENYIQLLDLVQSEILDDLNIIPKTDETFSMGHGEEGYPEHKFWTFRFKNQPNSDDDTADFYSISDKEKLAGYGAPAKASTMLNFFGITNQIKYIIDDNKLKNKKYIPGTEIQILNKKNIPFNPNKIIIFAWNFYKEIKNNNKDICSNFINVQNLQKNNYTE
jgi:hypothetical protein